MHSAENKNCQNCKQAFIIDAQDFAFYDKMQVPPPTFCPPCRFQRRLAFLNERALYKRPCDLCGKNFISIYSPDKKIPVYCPPCWWSDKWDRLVYGVSYDSSRPFLEQIGELAQRVPHQGLAVDYATLVNSEYVNFNGHTKNCYLAYIADFCDNVLYAEVLEHDKDSMDCTMLGESELCYENINCNKCFRVFFSEDLANCHDVYFSKQSVGCSDCFGCVNLRNKQYYIFNKPYTKEAYQEEMRKYSLGSHREVEQLKKQVREFWNGAFCRYMHGVHNVDASGDYVQYSKNARDMYQVRGAEDSRYCQIITLQPIRDCYDYTLWGSNAARIYECVITGEGVDSVKFSYECWPGCREVEYSMWTMNSANMLGCVGLKKKQYCILNTQYTRDEFESLKKKIIEDMHTRPYRDAKGRTYRYGEFFPVELSPFAYNETMAADYFPLSQEKALAQGYRWHERQPSSHKPTMRAEDIPDRIEDVSDAILNEVIVCKECAKPFRIVRAELDLLRRFGFPVPRACPNCRYKERLSRVNPPRLWDRTCAKCGKGMQTSYAPNRPETVYCEQCYNAEIV